MPTGFALIILGVWLIGQALAGELAARIIAAARRPELLAPSRPGFGERVVSEVPTKKFTK